MRNVRTKLTIFALVIALTIPCVTVFASTISKTYSFSRSGNTYNNAISVFQKQTNSNVTIYSPYFSTDKVQGTITFTPISGGSPINKSFITASSNTFYWLDSIPSGSYKISIQGYSIGTAVTADRIEFTFVE